MKRNLLLMLASVTLAATAVAQSPAWPPAPDRLTIPVWPAAAPGAPTDLGPEANMTTPKDNIIAGRPAIRIGTLGFSAGGHLSAAIANINDHRLYDPIDAADKLSCRPDFSVVLYPGYLALTDQNFAPNADIHPSASTPPTFVMQAEDDPVHVENALVYFQQLKVAKVPAELHIYADGGHGYGLRATGHSAANWPKDVERWLRTIKMVPAE